MTESSRVVTIEIKLETVDGDDTDHQPISPDNSNNATHSLIHHSGIDNTDYGKEFEGALQNKDTDHIFHWEDNDTQETKFSGTQEFLNIKQTQSSEPSVSLTSTQAEIKRKAKDIDDTDHHSKLADSSNKEIETAEHNKEFKGTLKNKEDTDTREIKFSDSQDFLNVKRALNSEENTICNTTTTGMIRRQNDIIVKIPLKKNAKKEPYKCNNCDYQCVYSGNLKKHSRIHTGEKPFKCSTCDYQCISSSNLKKHSMVHTGEKPFKCSSCDYRCISSSNLKMHRMKHTGETPFKCSTCDYQCISSSNLKKHSMVHTGEKPFKCSTCDYYCISTSHLKRHNTVHTKEKSFKCITSDYQCTYSSNLKNHSMKYTGEKPHKCKTCDYKCVKRNDMKRHRMKHT